VESAAFYRLGPSTLKETLPSPQAAGGSSFRTMRISSLPALLREGSAARWSRSGSGRRCSPTLAICSESLRFAMDYLAFDYHGDTYRHIDALCHVAFEAACTTATGITSRGVAIYGIEASRTASSAAACCSTSPAAGCVLGRARRARAPREAHGDNRPRLGAVVVGEVHQIRGRFRVVGHDAGQRLASRLVQQQQRSPADSRPPARPHSATGNLVCLPANQERHQRTP
jgi:hypothetical protein